MIQYLASQKAPPEAQASEPFQALMRNHMQIAEKDLAWALALARKAEVALPVGALAGKVLFKAKLSTGAELHEVVGSNARGTAIFRQAAGGVAFQIFAHGLSGPVWGAHLHGPATEAETAGVYISLCGAPAPAVLATCNFDGGELFISGFIAYDALGLWGTNGAEFRSLLNDGLLYVNVHTELNPAGEVRGQVYPR